MRDERASRRPSFQPGLGLRLADGQIWSLPLPPGPGGEPGASTLTWDNPAYRAILRVLVEAEDQGERFRAELALAIHLLSLNYQVDRDDLGALFDDQDGGRVGVDIAGSLSELARTHLGTVVSRPEVDRRSPLDHLRTELLRLIHFASQVLTLRLHRRGEGRGDLTVYSPLTRLRRSSSPSAR